MASASWRVTYSDGTSETVSTRIADELAWERRSRTEPGGVLERVLFMLHRATGTKQPLDAWVDNLADFDRIEDSEVESDPTDPPSATTPD